MTSEPRRPDIHDRKIGVWSLTAVIVLCVGPITWEVGLLLVPHHDLEHLAGAVNAVGGGSTFVFVLLSVILVYVGLKAPVLVASAIVVAGLAAYNKALPTWARLAVWVPVIAALPAAVVVMLLSATLVRLNSPATLQPIYQKNRAAYVTVRAISWCAIQYRQQHEQTGYPSTLDDLGTFPCRMPWSASVLPDYKFAYEPQGPSDRRNDFLIVAYPSEKPFLTYRSDASGLIYVEDVVDGRHYKRLIDSHDGTGDYSLPEQKEYELVGSLYDCLQVFADSSPETGYPADLRDIVSRTTELTRCSYPPELRSVYRQAVNNTVRLRDYEYIYQPGPKSGSGRISAFELSARCVAYGRSCMRNVDGNQNGEFHGTADDRAATPDDPIESLSGVRAR